MQKPYLILLGSFVAICLGVKAAEAKGRKPDNKNNYPDYNRMELHPKKEGKSEVEPAPTKTNVPPTSLNTPAHSPAEEDAPKPPPKPVFMPDDSSEPPLPDDIQKTLLRGTTDQ